MKKLIILITLLFTGLVSAASYMPQSKFDGQLHTDLTIYLNKNKCESHYSEPCLAIPKDYHPEYYELADQMENDLTKPIYEAKSNIVACVAVADDPATTEVDEAKTQEQDCLEKEVSHVCPDTYLKIRVADNSEVYCTKLLGYEQKITGKKYVAINETKKTNYETAKAASDAQEAAIAQALKAIEHGKRVIALLAVRNVPKGLTTAQIEQMNNTYKDIKNLLETGSLVTAKEKINLLTPDGTLVTEGDKTALVDEINKFLGL